LGARHAPYATTLRQLANALDLSPDKRAVLLSAAPVDRTANTFERPNAQRGNPRERARTRVAVERRLPTPLTSFVGRQQEVLDLTQLLSTTRLLTLTGAGGVGKTRLALEVARGTEAAFGEVTLVELAALADPALVPQAVAWAIGVGEQPGEPVVQRLQAVLGRRSRLLVIDNCEHLIQACAELVESMLRACPGVRFITTSREPLDLGAEFTWRVPSLSLPMAEGTVSVSNTGRSDAVRLFVERARQNRPGFALTRENAPAIAQICQRLDGIPLAIELAAARVNALTVEQIAARLHDCLGLLTGGGRTVPDRQRTLRGTLDWSYGLLSESEGLLLGRLSVFAGGWTLEAAEAVCAGDGLQSGQVFGVLSNLVDKSLVVAEERGSAVWYRLLDPLRAYALEKLQATGNETQVRSQHRDWYLRLAEEFESDWRSPRQHRWFERLEREEGNVRAALRWCLDRHEIVEGLRLAGAVARYFWDLGSRHVEGRLWLDELLATSDVSVPQRVKAKALSAAGFLAIYLGDHQSAQSSLAAALSLWRNLDDGRATGDTLVTLGLAAQTQNELSKARALYDEGLSVAREVGDRVTTYWALHQLASIAQLVGEYDRAQALHQESLALKQLQGDGYGIGMSLRGLAHVAWMTGDLRRSSTLIRDSLTYFQDIGHWRGIATCLVLLAHLWVEQSEDERAAQLLGAIDALLRSSDVERSASALLTITIDRARYEAAIGVVRTRLTPEAFQAAWTEGEGMNVEEVVAFARSAPPASLPLESQGGMGSARPPLSQRETEVLRLIAEGNSNHQIAVALVLSTRTVERHIANVYAKLGARNRADATVYALRHGIS
jgi:non-specific serine/threonine protein kinase